MPSNEERVRPLEKRSAANTTPTSFEQFAETLPRSIGARKARKPRGFESKPIDSQPPFLAALLQKTPTELSFQHRLMVWILKGLPRT